MLCSRCKCNFCCSSWLLNFTCCSKQRELVIIKKPSSHRRPGDGYWEMSITVHYFVMKKKGQIIIAKEPLSTVNPLISPGGHIYFKPIWRGGRGEGGGGLIETGDIFNLAKTMVSIFQKEPKYKVEKLKYKRRSCSRGSKTIPNFQLVNKPCIADQSTRSFTVRWLINTVYHLLLKNNKGEGRGAY